MKTKSLTYLRKIAEGQRCMIRSPVCNFNTETTVLAHVRMGIGMGQKPPDLCGAWACSDCHDLVDGRNSFKQAWLADEVRLWHLEGVIRTLIELEKLGYPATPQQ